jgi:hypothetical protein
MTAADIPDDLPGRADALQNVVLSRATGGAPDPVGYRVLREALLFEPSISHLLPRFVKSCRDLSQIWAYIKKFDSYHERREHIWAEFRPLLDHLEGRNRAPLDEGASTVLARFDFDSVHVVWSRALARRSEDPEGAITSARTLLETVCKHILDEASAVYDDSADLPKLYRLAAERLNIAPSQHTEEVFKQILGGCFSVVTGLGTLRNRLSDAHGRGRLPAKPAARHAELAVNLAGSIATFLVATWNARNDAQS